MDVLFQPNLNYSIDLYSNGRNEYCATKTIAEIIEMCNNLTPCDSIIIHKKSGANGYSAIVPLKIGTRTTYYVGSNALYDISDKQVILWENISGIYDGYYYAYDNNHDFIKYASASFSTQTIDDIEYCYDYDNRDDDYPPIMYITSNVEHLLINDTHKAGGAGSGYIGNSLVNNKKMVGFNVPTSDMASTKTESVNVYSASATINTPKSGNGFAKITFMKPCWGGEEKDIVWVGDENKMTVQTYNNTLLFKLYLSTTVIYSFTAYAGIGVYDTENIYVGFLIDYDLQLAKPSMVYKNDTSYAYNQESPTDAEMGLIYTWLSAGLPSE